MRKIFHSKHPEKTTENSYLIADTSFLIDIYKDEDLFPEVVYILRDHRLSLLIDQFVEFEYLKGITAPKELELRQNWIKKFLPVPSHQEIFRSIQENALLLSKIYSLKAVSCKDAGSIDLFIAGRAILHKLPIITSNCKHFPRPIFEIVHIFSFEQINTQNLKNIVILQFNFTAYTRLKHKLETNS